MAWSIKAALACKTIDKVVVSTDSDKYAQLAKFYGAEIVNRPPELARDETATEPVLKHALETVEKQGDKVETLVLLDPTSPFRLVSDINQCLELLKQPETESVVTVCEVDHNPYFVMGTVDDKKYFHYPLIKPEKPIFRRQDAPKVFRLNACVYVIKKELVLKEKRFTAKTRAIEMPLIRSVHIDSPEDFLFAEFLLDRKLIKLDY
jgi:CMP-N-acetylneuraminic acid synthetase